MVKSPQRSSNIKEKPLIRPVNFGPLFVLTFEWMWLWDASSPQMSLCHNYEER
jgi:hypothetical protein